jgi:hypothetical protein
MMARYGTVVVCAAAAAMSALAGCRSAPEAVPLESRAVAGTATAFERVNLPNCLGIARGTIAPSEAVCPGFISAGLGDLIGACAEVGSSLRPGERPSLLSLDVNGDGTIELLYDATQNYYCEGAPSALTCGSLGCPVSLFEQRDGRWISIGVLSAGDVDGAEVLVPAAGERYGAIRGGCAGDRPCDELTYYRWNGNAYAATEIHARGHWVDVTGEGLWTLVTDVAVLAGPASDAAVLERYPAGTDVVVIGDARGTAFKYVSPCRACASGFVEPTALRRAN